MTWEERSSCEAPSRCLDLNSVAVAATAAHEADLEDPGKAGEFAGGGGDESAWQVEGKEGAGCFDSFYVSNMKSGEDPNAIPSTEGDDNDLDVVVEGSKVEKPDKEEIVDEGRLDPASWTGDHCVYVEGRAATENQRDSGEQIAAKYAGSEGVTRMSIDVNVEQGLDERKVEKEEDLQLEDCKSVYSISDLVWGKVRSHPWWPGQIFDPSFGSEMALKLQRKHHFLVAYFGDKTFAWNDESRLRPFDSCFSDMVNQSSTDTFVCAVDDALEEVARRMEIGLTCGCNIDQMNTDFKYKKVENAGIREGAGYPIVDRFLIVNSFVPVSLLDSIQALAQFQYGDFGKLELTKMKARLEAFCRFKGYPDLPQFCSGRALSDNEESSSTPGSKSMEKDSVEKKRGRGRPPGKKRHIEEEGRKQRSLNELMETKVDSVFANGSRGRPKGKSASTSSGEKQKNVNSDSATSAIAANFPNEMLSQLCLAAGDPTKEYGFRPMILEFFTNWRDSFADKLAVDQMGMDGEALDESDLVPVEVKSDYLRDSYWSDIIFHESPKKEASSSGRKRNAKSKLQDNAKKTKAAESSPSSVPISDDSMIANDMKQSLGDCNPAALILNFSDPDALPSESDVIKVFSQYGPLKEEETEVSRKNKRASVVFRRGEDAEVAFSSAGKFSAFGPALLSYRLRYLSSPPNKEGC
ncbi:Serine/threonine-protein kinase ATM [Apostasia shenzhenica]|uniref:Serine/threonine-protein kinase ATM n=1 Tax=Apostasia shenzhenica TaxID=1088818 RepID=A0A2I0B4C7_9ASPA|nr:Serine/threonine-protein kinase ATM [Apostasia shenzhenica]